MPFLRLLAFLLSTLFLTSCASIGSDSSRLDSFVNAEMQRQKVPGVAVVVISNGQVVKSTGYGFANVELGVPTTPDTIFESGSLGKQFTAVAVMLQVEDGKLALDDPISKYLPGAPDGWRSITVRHLLTHTSGIPDYNEETFDVRRDYSEDELAKFAFGLTPDFPPGSRWNYSNTGYVLLGIIVHKTSGHFYGDVLRDRVFAPLGMKTARIITEEDIVPHRAAGYRLVNGQLKNQEWVSPVLNTTADGSLYFNLHDLAAWDAGLRSGAILTPQSWKQILEPVRLNSGASFPYGFGWFLDDFSGQKRQHHSGHWQGFSTYISRYLNDDLTVAVLCNLATANASSFVDGIAAVYNPRLATPLSAIPDQEPKTTARLMALLSSAAQDKLIPDQFAIVPAGFFPNVSTRYRNLLSDLGPLFRTELLERHQLGDDVEYRYRAIYANKSVLVRLGLTPDAKIVVLSIQEEGKP